MEKSSKRSFFMAVFFALALPFCLLPAAWADEGNYLVEYRGEAEGIVAVDGDLFAHFSDLLPGDEVGGTVTILNKGESVREVYFYTVATQPSGNEKADELLCLLQLRIARADTGEILYEGDIHADELNDPLLLGSFEPGESKTLQYEVSVPLSIGEEYVSLGNEVHWVFAVPDDASDPENAFTISQTGDFFSGVVPLLLLVVAGSGLIVLASLKRNERKSERG